MTESLRILATLSLPEIVLMLQNDPAWTLPLFSYNRHARMHEARQAFARGEMRVESVKRERKGRAA